MYSLLSLYIRKWQKYVNLLLKGLNQQNDTNEYSWHEIYFYNIYEKNQFSQTIYVTEIPKYIISKESCTTKSIDCRILYHIHICHLSNAKQLVILPTTDLIVTNPNHHSQHALQENYLRLKADKTSTNLQAFHPENSSIKRQSLFTPCGVP